MTDDDPVTYTPDDCRNHDGPLPPALWRVVGWVLDEDEYGRMDALMRPLVRALVNAGFQTAGSCQGGPGHPVRDPIIRLRGGEEEGRMAVATAMDWGYPSARCGG